MLFGLFGMNNFGNDATLIVTLHHLRQRLPEAEVVCVCNGLPEGATAYGATTLSLDPLPPRGQWRIGNPLLRNAYLALATLVTEPLRRRRVRQMLGKVDLLLVVGTGVLDDFGALPWEYPSWLLRWCRGARKLGAEIEFIAVGAGPINNPLNRWLLKRAIGLSSRRTYRDVVSRRYLQSIGVDAGGDQVVPDLVFSLPRDWPPLGRPPSTPPASVGVGVMGYFGWSNSAQKGDKGKQLYQDYIGKIGRFVVWLLNEGYDVRLMVGELPTDEVAVGDVLALVSADPKWDRNRQLAAERIESLEDVLREVSRTDIVVATRFHNVICALALGRPVVSIGYSTKFDALMEEMQLGSYSQHIENVDVDLLIRQFRLLVANHASAVEGIRGKAAHYRHLLDGLYDSTFGRAADDGPHLKSTSEPIQNGALDGHRPQ